jgi:hypothetical protein
MLTSDVVPVRVVHFFDPPVAEGEFAHPVDAASDAGGEAEAGVGGGGVESVCCEGIDG